MPKYSPEQEFAVMDYNPHQYNFGKVGGKVEQNA
jgi:hypothetical protein